MKKTWIPLLSLLTLLTTPTLKGQDTAPDEGLESMEINDIASGKGKPDFLIPKDWELTHVTSIKSSPETFTGAGEEQLHNLWFRDPEGNLYMVRVFDAVSKAWVVDLKADKPQVLRMKRKAASAEKDGVLDNSASESLHACQGFLVERSPGSTKHQWVAGHHISGNGTRYRVRFSADIQNESGALIRTNYECTVIRTGEDWTLISLETR